MSILFNRNASSGGLDIVAKIMNKYLHIELGKAMSLSGMCVALSAALVYDKKTVVLSVLGTYFNGIVLDHFIFDNSRKRRVCIITEKEKELRQFIIEDLHSGLSVLGTYFNGIVLDHFIFDNSRKRRVCIITEKEKELRQFIIEDLHSGATMYEAIGNGIVLDHFIFDNSRKRRVCIITEKEKELRQFIIEDLHSGATMYEAIGAYNFEKHNEIITIVDNSEYQKLMNFIKRISEADEFYQPGRPQSLYYDLQRIQYAVSAKKIMFCGQPFQLSAFCIRKPLVRREIQNKVSAGRTAPSCAAAHHRNTRKRSAPDWNRRTHHQFLCPRHSVVLLSYTGRFFVYCLLFTGLFNPFVILLQKACTFSAERRKCGNRLI